MKSPDKYLKYNIYTMLSTTSYLYTYLLKQIQLTSIGYNQEIIRRKLAKLNI